MTEIEARLERAALVKPMMICLDDVQWADAGTIAALGVLPRRLRSLPIVWMIAYRPGEAPPSLRDVVDRLVRGGADRVVLDGLGEDDVALVISDIVHGQADAELLHLADRAEGSPYLLVELLRGLLEEGLVHRTDGLVELTGDELPVRVRETMRERLNRHAERGAPGGPGGVRPGPLVQLRVCWRPCSTSRRAPSWRRSTSWSGPICSPRPPTAGSDSGTT